MNATASLFHDTRYEKKNNTYPVKVCVIFERKNKLYKTGIDLTQDDWQKMHSARPGNLSETRINCNLKLKQAKDIIELIPDFSFDAFEKKFVGGSFSKDVYANMQTYSDNLQKEGRINTASSYSCALKSLKDFKSSIQFQDITPSFLANYEAHMLKNGASITTVGIYLRTLRAIVNMALSEGIIKQEQYPFGKRKYQIPKGRNIKKALTLAQIQKIFEYETIEGTTEDKAKDFWIFSYLCNGMNMKDIAQLKWKDYNGEKITFIRAKTERSTRGNMKQIVAVLPEEAQTIIKKWGTSEREPDNYLFPVLNKKMTALDEWKAIQNFTGVVNTWMKRIGEHFGFEVKLTTYAARHSFSTVLKRSGAPVEYISEALGHTDIATTQSYLDSFEDNVKRDFALKLTDFSKNKTNQK